MLLTQSILAVLTFCPVGLASLSQSFPLLEEDTFQMRSILRREGLWELLVALEAVPAPSARNDELTLNHDPERGVDSIYFRSEPLQEIGRGVYDRPLLLRVSGQNAIYLYRALREHFRRQRDPSIRHRYLIGPGIIGNHPLDDEFVFWAAGALEIQCRLPTTVHFTYFLTESARCEIAMDQFLVRTRRARTTRIREQLEQNSFWPMPR